jgi:hypothetical protein
MRAFLASLMALLVGVPVAYAAAHDGWFVRVCPAKTEANRIHLAIYGGRQRGSAGPGPRADHPTKSTCLAGFTPWQGSPCGAARPRCRATFNLTSMSVSGSAIISFSAWNSMITKITKII